eukprot:m.125418 g.125418  ORF g.125418 m.125418 type:complete len:106 (-) comp9690_c0_seq2:112-429(-)
MSTEHWQQNTKSWPIALQTDKLTVLHGLQAFEDVSRFLPQEELPLIQPDNVPVPPLTFVQPELVERDESAPVSPISQQHIQGASSVLAEAGSLERWAVIVDNASA